MGRFTRFLTQFTPRTGRLIRESGDFFNVGDSARLRELSDIDVSARLGNLYRGFWEGTVPANTTYDFVIDMPEGLDLFGFTRISTAVDVSLYTTFLSCTGFVSAEGPIDGLSFDRRQGKVRSLYLSVRSTGRPLFLELLRIVLNSFCSYQVQDP